MMIYVSDSPMWRNIRYLRRRKRLSLKKLAERTGIPCWTLLGIETRFLRDIDYDDLVSLCGVLHVTQEALIEGDLSNNAIPGA